jgi:predicted ATP-grasp superfamily ATP-dependent carboligase
VWGKAVVWAEADGVAPDTRAWLARDDVRDVPAPGDALRRGQPVCTVFATGSDEATCRRALIATSRTLELQGSVVSA